MTEVENTLSQIIEAAGHFHQTHPQNTSVDATYGYFTHHPFARLNQKRLKEIMLRVNRRSKHLGRPLRLLDLCCGGGLISSALADLGHQVVGIDSNQEEIALATEFNAKKSCSASFVMEDLLSDSWFNSVSRLLNGPLDGVILAYALHHLPEVERFLFYLSENLSPQAFLLINEENPISPSFRMKHILRSMIQKDTETEWHRSYRHWKKTLESADFRVHAPKGLDLIPGFQLNPLLSWSLVFEAEKR